MTITICSRFPIVLLSCAAVVVVLLVTVEASRPKPCQDSTRSTVAFAPTFQFHANFDKRIFKIRRRNHGISKHDCVVVKGSRERSRSMMMMRRRIPILHETDRLLVINKPPGISHHNDDRDEYDDDEYEMGIISLLRQQIEDDRQELQQKEETTTPPPFRLYGVHRLDRETSGILILAKDGDMASELSKAFRDKMVCKYYIGISSKKPQQKKQGWVKGFMQRSRAKSWILARTIPTSASTTSTTNKNSSSHSKENGSRTTQEDESDINDDDDTNEEQFKTNTNNQSLSSTIPKPSMAVTRFFTASLTVLNDRQASTTTIATADNEYVVTPKTCLLFRPYTGKTHQLRVAAKSVGLPLLGDPIYRDGTHRQQQPVVRQTVKDQTTTTTAATTTTKTKHYRMHLHASAIHIQLSNGPLTVWSPPPFDELWDTPSTTSSGTTTISQDNHSSFQELVQRLMEKYCEEPAILEVMKKMTTK
jgi:23S rRNA-/tRNA-specific pseudouridylate synthase